VCFHFARKQAKQLEEQKKDEERQRWVGTQFIRKMNSNHSVFIVPQNISVDTV